MNGDYEKRAALAELPIEEILADGRVFSQILASSYLPMPKTLDYYRYLSPAKLRSCLETYESWIREYADEIGVLTEAREACFSFENDEAFRYMLKIFPWVMSAHSGSLESAECRHYGIVHSCYVGPEATRTEYVENLSSYITDLKMRCDFLERFMEVIRQTVSMLPAPLPLPDMILPDECSLGDVLIGFEQVSRRSGRCESGPFKAFDAIGGCHMDEIRVCALTSEECNRYGLEELAYPPVLGSNYRWPTTSLKYWLAVPLETYKFYRSHPDVIDEHIQILSRAFDGYDRYLTVDNLKSMKKNFQAMMS